MSDIAGRLKNAAVPFGYLRHGAVPDGPGLYSFWLRGRCLYVGMSDDLRRRIHQHATMEANPALARYFAAYRNEIKVSAVPVRGADLRREEAGAIEELRPATNRTGEDPP